MISLCAIVNMLFLYICFHTNRYTHSLWSMNTVLLQCITIRRLSSPSYLIAPSYPRSTKTHPGPVVHLSDSPKDEGKVSVQIKETLSTTPAFLLQGRCDFSFLFLMFFSIQNSLTPLLNISCILVLPKNIIPRCLSAIICLLSLFYRFQMQTFLHIVLSCIFLPKRELSDVFL